MADRCHFAGWVDTRLYASALDLFLETFPLGCGITGRAIVPFPKGEVFATFTEGSPETLVKMPLAQTQKGVSSSVDALNALLAELGDEYLALAVTWS